MAINFYPASRKVALAGFRIRCCINKESKQTFVGEAKKVCLVVALWSTRPSHTVFCMNIRVDTLEYTNALEQAGIARPHAEAIAKLQARAVNDLVEHELVTKEHLRSELSQLRSELKSEMSQLELRLKDEIRTETGALKVQLRALQYGGAIAAFAISLVVLFSRLIK